MIKQRKKKKVYAIIQARMNSSRLPGKVLMDLCGKPILWHIVKRLKKCEMLDGIIIATSKNKKDNKIIDFAKRYKIRSFRGSENNVLKRYVDVGSRLKVDYIVRVTGDAPLIEPNEIDKFIKVIKNKQADFVVNNPDILSVHEGFSAISLSALKKILNVKDLKDYHKEHVTIYLKEYPKLVKTIYLKPNKFFQKSGYRLSIDSMSDLKFIKKIYKKFWNGKGIIDLKKVIKFLEKTPQLKFINAHVVQKKVKQKSRKIIFIIEGGEELGFGHFTRTTQVAKYLVEYKNYGAIFITNNRTLSQKIKKLGFKNYLLLFKNIERINSKNVCTIVKKEKADLVLLDVKNNHDPSKIINFLKKEFNDINIILIDNRTKARFLVDKNIYPIPKELISNLKWKEDKGETYAGLEFFPLKQEFVKAKNIKKVKNSITVSMGGSDPNNITTFLMKNLINTGRKVNIIIGPAFRHKKQIKILALRYKEIFKLYQEPDNYARIIASSSLVITALGILIFEVSYLGIPTIVLGNYREDLKVGKILDKMGYCKYLGYYKIVKQKNINKVILYVLNKKEKLVVKTSKNGTKNMSKAILSS